MIVQKNPLTMAGEIVRCWLFTYSTPVEDACALLPHPLEPLTHNGHAFWNVVVCRLRHMRPYGLPRLAGIGYWHVAYRLYVRYPIPGRSPIGGLYFLRSDCDNPLMTVAGNLLTNFHFHTARIRVAERSDAVDIHVDSPDAAASAHLETRVPVHLPPHSAFQSLDEAERFLTYEPYGISVEDDGSVNVVKVIRNERAWHSRLVHANGAHWAFFDDKRIAPEICYQVDPIVYHWQRARVYQPAKGA